MQSSPTPGTSIDRPESIHENSRGGLHLRSPLDCGWNLIQYLTEVMNKAPSLRRVQRKVPDSTTSSSIGHIEPERIPALPSVSSATSRTRSWLGPGSVREVDREFRRRRSERTTRNEVDHENALYETFDSHRIVIGIDYGTTFTSKAALAQHLDMYTVVNIANNA
jgi:hypothetical protein